MSGGGCEKCTWPLSDHGAETGRCHGHAKVRDEEGQPTGELRPCGRWPTPGATVCRAHGSASPQSKASQQRVLTRRAAIAELEQQGRVVDGDDPDRSLLERVREHATSVAYMGRTAAQRTSGVSKKSRMFAMMYEDECRELERWARICTDSGIAEDRVRAAASIDTLNDMPSPLAHIIDRFSA